MDIGLGEFLDFRRQQTAFCQRLGDANVGAQGRDQVAAVDDPGCIGGKPVGEGLGIVSGIG